MIMMRSDTMLTKVMLLFAASVVLAGCPDETVDTTPIVPDMTMEEDMTMVEEDMGSEPDLAEEDMGMPEEDMNMEVDLGPMNFELSGTWVLREYADQTPGAEIITFTLVNEVDAVEVTGTYQLPDGGASGEVMGTYLQDEVELNWMTPDSQLPYQFLNGAINGDTIVGDYNDPALGGIPQDTIMERGE